jgi:multiple sugar transport system substrate-binding protein
MKETIMSPFKVQTIFWTFVLFLVVGSAGCGPKTPAGPVTIRVLTTNQAGMTADEWNLVAQQFMTANPDIQVQLSFGSDSQVDELFSKGMSAYPPAYDLVMVNPSWVDRWIKAGYLADITSRITPDMQQNIFPKAWEVVTRSGKSYGVPWLPDMKFLYYNRNLLLQAGFSTPPRTWEELIGMAQTMKDKGLVSFPLTWAWHQPDDATADFTALLNGNGGKFLDDQGHPIFNNDQGVAVLTWMKKTIDDGLSDPASLTFSEGNVLRTFNSGQAAFALDWISLYDSSQFDRANSQIIGKVGITAVPVFQSMITTVMSTSVNGTRSLAIAGSSLHGDQAWKFISYVVSLDVQMKNASAQLPVWSTAYVDGNLNVLRASTRSSPITVPVFAAQFKNIDILPTIAYYPEGSAALQQAIQMALTGQKSPKDALDAAAAQWVGLAK